MATVNKRVGLPQAIVINGVDAGGAMTATINCGNEVIMRSSPDGLQVPVLDKECQFVRGTVVTQDWIEMITLLIGAVGTYVFYERKSGVAEATGFIKHTLTAPVIHRATLGFNQGGYATLTFDFECRAASETATIADMWAVSDTQAAPTYKSAARGGWRIITAILGGTLNVYHATGFNFSLTLPLVKACNDADIAYTCVDARLDGLSAAGSINFQDAAVASAKLTCQQLALAAVGVLVITVKQSGAAANKIITIANCCILSVGGNSDVNTPFTGYTASFEVANDPSVPLTLTGTNKIIVIVDAT